MWHVHAHRKCCFARGQVLPLTQRCANPNARHLYQGLEILFWLENETQLGVPPLLQIPVFPPLPCLNQSTLLMCPCWTFVPAFSATPYWGLSVNTDSSFPELSTSLSPHADEEGSLVIGPWDLESAERPRTQTRLEPGSSTYLLHVLRSVVQLWKFRIMQ